MKETNNHKNKTSLIASVVVIAAALLFAAWRLGFNPFPGSNEWHWSYEKTIIAGEHKANSNPDIIQLKNDCYRIYSHGVGEIMTVCTIFIVIIPATGQTGNLKEKESKKRLCPPS